MTEPIESYIIPSERHGWYAVAEVPVGKSKWLLPPRHRRWRLTRKGALKAIPQARCDVRRDLEKRERGLARDRERQQQREDVGQ